MKNYEVLKTDILLEDWISYYEGSSKSKAIDIYLDLTETNSGSWVMVLEDGKIICDSNPEHIHDLDMVWAEWEELMKGVCLS